MRTLRTSQPAFSCRLFALLALGAAGCNTWIPEGQLIDSVSCKTLFDTHPNPVDGVYTLHPESNEWGFDAYCDMTTDGGGWTLVARFSNADDIVLGVEDFRWMSDAGEWWYDRWESGGEPTRRDVNADAISQAFWEVRGDELKLSRSDNPDNAHLLMTTEDCLQSSSFRFHITRFGDFRTDSWATNEAQGTCKADFGNNFAETAGFSQVGCQLADIGNPLGMSFWAHWQSDAAVIMIGGGGDNCDSADHGIGITDTNEATFVTPKGTHSEADLGDSAFHAGMPMTDYALNLFVR